jgi:hypothetical protein
MRATGIDPRDPVALRRVSALLHDARVVSVSWNDVFRMTLERPGYEHAALLSKGCWSLGRRWIYPWVECELAIGPVTAVSAKDGGEDQDLNGFAAMRIGNPSRLVIGRHLGEITLNLSERSTLALCDTTTPVRSDEGMIVFSAEPMDLSFIRPLLETR